VGGAASFNTPPIIFMADGAVERLASAVMPGVLRNL